MMQVINPDKLKPDPLTKMYPIEVSKNVPKYLLITLISIGVLGIIGTLLVFPFKTKVSKTDEEIEECSIEVHENIIEIDAVKVPISLVSQNFNFIIGPNSEIKVKQVIEEEEEKQRIDKLEIEKNQSTNLFKNRNKSLIILKNTHGHLNTISFASNHQQIYEIGIIHPRIKESVATNNLLKALFNFRSFKYAILIFCLSCKIVYIIYYIFRFTIYIS